LPADWNVGDWIQDRWQVHRVLKGGMGVVYIVYDRDWREVLAAKNVQDPAGDPQVVLNVDRSHIRSHI
jgi:hypothetical protein